MSKPIIMRRGLSVYADGTILLTRCPRCFMENYAMSVGNGWCAWCGYSAHSDEALKREIEEIKNQQNKEENE